MRQFGAFDAKTHFSEILGNIANGERVVITRRGQKVAMIVPFTPEQDADPVNDSIRALKQLRKGVKLGRHLSIKKMMEEGRR